MRINQNYRSRFFTREKYLSVVIETNIISQEWHITKAQIFRVIKSLQYYVHPPLLLTYKDNSLQRYTFYYYIAIPPPDIYLLYNHIEYNHQTQASF